MCGRLRKDSLRRVADALGVSTDYLLGRVKQPAERDLEVAVLFRRLQGMSEEARKGKIVSGR